MSLPRERAEEILESKDPHIACAWCENHGYDESWAIIDGAVVIYNLNNPPAWVPTELDDNGNTPTQHIRIQAPRENWVALLDAYDGAIDGVGYRPLDAEALIEEIRQTVKSSDDRG